MIRCYIPGFVRLKKEYRYGDTQVLTDGTFTLVIDGMCGAGTTKLISWLKKNKIKKVWLLVTHWHDDHFKGIEQILKDSYFEPQILICPNPEWLKPGLKGEGGKYVQNCMDDGVRVTSLAKKKGVPIRYPVSGSSFSFGDLKFKVYKSLPKKPIPNDPYAWDFLNLGSLSAYFPELNYWTSGDGHGDCTLRDRIKKLKLNGKIKFFKIDHHGNYCTQSDAVFMKEQGAEYCWYNDIEPDGTGTTEFTVYGARRCKQAGIHVFESVGDINWIAQPGKVVIYKDFKKYTYSCSYKGKSTLKGSSDKVAKDVIAGKYGNSNERITNLLDAGYYPIAIQNRVNELVKEG